MSHLPDATTFSGFDLGPRPGTFQACSLCNRLDYILPPNSLRQSPAVGSSARACGAPRPTRTHHKPGPSLVRSPGQFMQPRITPPSGLTSTCNGELGSPCVLATGRAIVAATHFSEVEPYGGDEMNSCGAPSGKVSLPESVARLRVGRMPAKEMNRCP